MPHTDAAESHFRSIFEQAPIGIAAFSIETGAYLDVNPAYCGIVGHSAAELLAGTIQDITHPDDRSEDDRRFAALAAGLRRPFRIEKRYVRSDGSTVWGAVTVVPQVLAGRPTGQAISILKDITEAKAHERERERRAQFDTLYARMLINLTGSYMHEVDLAIAAALEEFCRFVGVDYAFVAMLREDGQSWGLTHSWHVPSAPSIAEAVARVPMNVAGWTVATLLADNDIRISSLDDFPAAATGDRAFHAALGIGSLLEVPMKGRAQAIVGAIGLLSRAQGVAWSDDDVRLTRLLGSAIASTIERQRAQREIRVSQEAVIFALARLAESRDNITGRHIECVQELCREIALEMRQDPAFAPVVDEGFIDTLVRSAPLHDIGKVGIPDAVLMKPGRLTPVEFELVKTHTTIGSNTLQAVLERHPGNAEVAMGADIARSHHERWDGTGYPDGLKGDAIPLAARIMAVADVYEAMRSVRPYKDACTHEECVEAIRAGAGTQFDPAIAAAFVRVAPTLSTAWNACQLQPEPPLAGNSGVVHA